MRYDTTKQKKRFYLESLRPIAETGLKQDINQGEQEEPSFFDKVDKYANYADDALAVLAVPSWSTPWSRVAHGVASGIVDAYQIGRGIYKGDWGSVAENAAELGMDIIGAKMKTPKIVPGKTLKHYPPWPRRPKTKPSSWHTRPHTLQDVKEAEAFTKFKKESIPFINTGLHGTTFNDPYLKNQYGIDIYNILGQTRATPEELEALENNNIDKFSLYQELREEAKRSNRKLYQNLETGEYYYR